MTDLLQFVRSLGSFSEESWQLLQSFTVTITLKKGDYLVQPQKVCETLFFISQGYCRAFYVQDGLEVNTSFYFENEIATHINSYITGAKASFAIQACEPVTAYRFDKKQVLDAGCSAPEIAAAGKRSLQLIAAKQEKQLELFRLLSARQRYEYLEQHQPAMLRRVSLTQLSSYLGVTRETLSRIRKKRTAGIIL